MLAVGGDCVMVMTRGRPAKILENSHTKIRSVSVRMSNFIRVKGGLKANERTKFLLTKMVIRYLTN